MARRSLSRVSRSRRRSDRDGGATRRPGPAGSGRRFGWWVALTAAALIGPAVVAPGRSVPVPSRPVVPLDDPGVTAANPGAAVGFVWSAGAPGGWLAEANGRVVAQGGAPAVEPAASASPATSAAGAGSSRSQRALLLAARSEVVR